MGTYGSIILKVETGYQYIIISHDGYPQEPGIGWMLLNHYNNKEIISKLMEAGDGSQLLETLEESEFYNAGDIEEADKDVYPVEVPDLKTALEDAGNTYSYVYQNDTWYIWDNEDLVFNSGLDSSNCTKDGELILLENCVDQLDKEDGERKIAHRHSPPSIPFTMDLFDIESQLKCYSKVKSPEVFAQYKRDTIEYLTKQIKIVEDFKEDGQE